METKADIDNLRTENSTLQQENLKLVQTLNQLKVELAAAEAQNNQNASAIMQQLFQAAQNASALAPLTMPAPVPPVAPQAAAPTEKPAAQDNDRIGGQGQQKPQETQDEAVTDAKEEKDTNQDVGKQENQGQEPNAAPTPAAKLTTYKPPPEGPMH